MELFGRSPHLSHKTHLGTQANEDQQREEALSFPNYHTPLGAAGECFPYMCAIKTSAIKKRVH